MLIVDGRMWRSSQDTSIWGDWGWDESNTIYRRQDPTRALLGEEQFAWLERTIRTDSSPLICVTGMNGLHTVWSGVKESEETGERFAQRDRVAADYAGWVAAGVDRVLELLGSRSGVVSVYGDVHVGGILRNPEHRLYECCFGPIGRHGGRRPKEGFGPTMTDYDGRAVEVHAFYHHQYASPELEERTGPRYWNFLEMRFDPREADPALGFRVRNLIDPPGHEPRGGGHVEDRASNTGRAATARLPEVATLPNADVLVSTTEGEPLRATRSDAEGRVHLPGLPDVEPGTPLLVTAHADGEAEAKVVTAEPA
jgi:hypothetical protein